MKFPTPFTVGHHVYSSTTSDDYGREVAVYTPAAGSAGTPVKVHGWGSPTSAEPDVAGHDRVVVDVELLVPKGTGFGPHDLVDLPEGQFEVIGHPADHTNGPFMPGFGGLVIKLRRVEG